jgi:hypothetical protein
MTVKTLFCLAPLFFLGACANLNHSEQNTTSQDKPTGFSINNEDYLEPGSTPARLISLSSQTLRDFQNTNDVFKTSIFDLREMNGIRDYRDSNYHIHNGVFTVTYRPRTFYGSNIKTYTPYCPVFYDSHQKKMIENYILQINRVFPVNLSDLSEYLMLSSFSSCALLNRNYQAKESPVSEHDNLVLGDKFAMTVLMHEGKMDMVNVIVNHNELLHTQSLMNPKELKDYYQKSHRYLQKQNRQLLNQKNLYQWWQLSEQLN